MKLLFQEEADHFQVNAMIIEENGHDGRSVLADFLVRPRNDSEFVAQFRFRQEWFDDRLRFMDHQENRFLKIRSDGKLIYDRRLTLHLACSMHLSRYPMDSQLCEIAFASYAYTTDDIKYEWDTEAIRIHDGANGALPNFDIAMFRNGTCHSKTNTGIYLSNFSISENPLIFENVSSHFFKCKQQCDGGHYDFCRCRCKYCC
ncbi:unnamed protein product [Strongylus vulgaris]|uniref:Neurotransmitter-gated ion-channel ligand-binding domain-containing protein n=1 Tax=Strongylus vulgaris TaxID=40348 RepID=A0A3P7KEI3_STRVU|nr:unnamed protein product [Strongylus vulgaris]